MSDATVNKFKWFWNDQDIEQEQWLRAMALEGLHLERVFWFSWTFRKGAPKDIVYRVDFNQAVHDAERQLMKDAGWEHAAESFGSQYWRTDAANSGQLALFADAASRAAKFKRLLVLFVPCIMMAILMSNPARASDMLDQLSWPFRVVIGAALAVAAIGFVRLLVRLWRVSQEA